MVNYIINSRYNFNTYLNFITIKKVKGLNIIESFVWVSFDRLEFKIDYILKAYRLLDYKVRYNNIISNSVLKIIILSIIIDTLLNKRLR
jgi:hypothetical protein